MKDKEEQPDVTGHDLPTYPSIHTILFALTRLEAYFTLHPPEEPTENTTGDTNEGEADEP